jgi:hypothetical protein
MMGANILQEAKNAVLASVETQIRRIFTHFAAGASAVDACAQDPSCMHCRIDKHKKAYNMNRVCTGVAASATDAYAIVPCRFVNEPRAVCPTLCEPRSS